MPIESQFAGNSYLEQVCLVGAGLAQTILLAMPSEASRIADRHTVNKNLRHQLAEVNARLEHHERISHILLCKDPWTIKNGLLTPTLKVKRNVLEEKYLETLVSLSQGGTSNADPILWE